MNAFAASISYRLLGLLFLLTCFHFNGVLAAETRSPAFDIAKVGNSASLQGHLDIFLDSSLSMEIKQVLDSGVFESVGNRSYSRPSSESAVWVRFALTNSSPETVSRNLVYGTRLTDSVTAYLPNGSDGFIAHYAGEDSELVDRQVPLALPVFELSVSPQEELIFYLRLVDESPHPVKLFLKSWPELERSESSRNLINGLFMGTLLLLTFYGIYLAARSKGERMYLWFLAYVVGVLGNTAFYHWGGAGIYLPAEIRGELNNRLIVVSAVITFWAAERFAFYLLDLRLDNPKLAGWFKGLNYLRFIALISVIILPFNIASMITVACLPPILVPVGLALPKVFRGDRIAIMYSATWVMLVGSVVVMYAEIFGFIPHMYRGGQSIYIALEIQFFVFCVAMNDKVRRIEDERAEALQAELEAYARNAALSKSFERFVPKAFLDRLERESITEIELGQCVEKRMSTLFGDIRSFTSLFEKMSTEENFAFINEYLGYMEPVIHENDGFIDKYMGDAVMALFDGDVLGEEEGGAMQAVLAAHGMYKALDSYNDVRAQRGDPPISIGIGIHTGGLMLGTIGGQNRLNASVIGDSVNLASRVEGLTKLYGARTLVTEGTIDCLPENHGLSFRTVGLVRVKGKNRPTMLYESLDCDPPESCAMKKALQEQFAEAREAFCKGNMEAALKGFKFVLSNNPEDKAARVHQSLCEKMIREGLPSGWDGAYTMETK